MWYTSTQEAHHTTDLVLSIQAHRLCTGFWELFYFKYFCSTSPKSQHQLNTWLKCSIYTCVYICLHVCLCVCYLTVWVPSCTIQICVGMMPRCLHRLRICPLSYCCKVSPHNLQAAGEVQNIVRYVQFFSLTVTNFCYYWINSINIIPTQKEPVFLGWITWHLPSIQTPWYLVSRQKVPSWAGTRSCRSPLMVVHCRSHGLLEMLM